jgi:hypothetical protein
VTRGALVCAGARTSRATKADLELVIRYERDCWVARNEKLVVSGRTLPELDASLAEALGKAGEFGNSSVTVFMGFDFSTIPTWIRQYASHYFNRYVTVDLRKTGNGVESRGAEPARTTVSGGNKK